MRVEKFSDRRRPYRNLRRAGVERNVVHLKKSKLPGTEKTRVVQAVLDRWVGPDPMGLVGHSRDLGSFSKDNGELP